MCQLFPNLNNMGYPDKTAFVIKEIHIYVTGQSIRYSCAQKATE